MWDVYVGWHLRAPKLQEILSHAAKTPALFLDLMSLGLELRKDLSDVKIYSNTYNVTFPSNISDSDITKYLKWWIGKGGKGDDFLFNMFGICVKKMGL